MPKIYVVDPGSEGRRITDDGLIGNYFPGRGDGRRPAILLLGGSEGGIARGISRDAKAFAAEGYTVFNISYFRAPGQSEKLEMIPLETFDRALAWMARQPEVQPDRIAVMGASKGAEAALLIASRHPELRAVVAGMPSSVVWGGVNWATFISHQSSWSENGKPVPFLALAPFDWKTVASVYRNVLVASPELDRAAIPVERITAPILLICGEADTMWPSCTMARQIEARAAKYGHPKVSILAYPNAGHAVFGKPYLRSDEAYPRLQGTGGTSDSNNAAREDAAPRVDAFLKDTLGATAPPAT